MYITNAFPLGGSGLDTRQSLTEEEICQSSKDFDLMIISITLRVDLTDYNSIAVKTINFYQNNFLCVLELLILFNGWLVFCGI